MNVLEGMVWPKVVPLFYKDAHWNSKRKLLKIQFTFTRTGDSVSTLYYRFGRWDVDGVSDVRVRNLPLNSNVFLHRGNRVPKQLTTSLRAVNVPHWLFEVIPAVLSHAEWRDPKNRAYYEAAESQAPVVTFILHLESGAWRSDAWGGASKIKKEILDIVRQSTD